MENDHLCHFRIAIFYWQLQRKWHWIKFQTSNLSKFQNTNLPIQLHVNKVLQFDSMPFPLQLPIKYCYSGILNICLCFYQNIIEVFPVTVIWIVLFFRLEVFVIWNRESVHFFLFQILKTCILNVTSHRCQHLLNIIFDIMCYQNLF